jgi:hypothetical protein
MKPANPLGRLRGEWSRLAPLRQRAWLALLALLLVQAQGLGLWHRVAHGGPPAGAAAMSAEAPRALHEHCDAPHQAHDHAHDAHHGHHEHQAHHAHHAHHGLFGHDEGDESGCRLFDQLAAADALLAASALVADELPPTVAMAAAPSHSAARALRPYQARAPPQA